MDKIEPRRPRKFAGLRSRYLSLSVVRGVASLRLFASPSPLPVFKSMVGDAILRDQPAPKHHEGIASALTLDPKDAAKTSECFRGMAEDNEAKSLLSIYGPNLRTKGRLSLYAVKVPHGPAVAS